jgi:hypothetical protein
MMQESIKNSQCKGGLYHDYQIVDNAIDGVIEMCTNCRERKYFNNKIPNWIYLSYHLKSFLQPTDPKYKRHYATTN